jgi:hypothetical protein
MTLLTRFLNWLASMIVGPVAPADDGLWFDL